MYSAQYSCFKQGWTEIWTWVSRIQGWSNKTFRLPIRASYSTFQWVTEMISKNLGLLLWKKEKSLWERVDLAPTVHTGTYPFYGQPSHPHSVFWRARKGLVRTPIAEWGGLQGGKGVRIPFPLWQLTCFASVKNKGKSVWIDWVNEGDSTRMDGHQFL